MILAILIVVTRGMNSFQFRVGIRLFTVQTRFLSVAAYFPKPNVHLYGINCSKMFMTIIIKYLSQNRFI
jgi:hypothetical protein